MKYLSLLIFLLITQSLKAQVQKVTDCNCKATDTLSPKELKNRMQVVCQALSDNDIAPDGSKFNYIWEEDFWELACADKGKDTKEVAYKKLQCMWMKYRERFRGYNYSGQTVKDPNLLKFMCDLSYHRDVIRMIEVYKLDVNFIDPADGKSIMDFVIDRMKQIKKAPPVDKANLEEFENLYEVLKKNNIKTAAEIRAMNKN